jgi:PAS domain S-box-containing protein
LVCQKLSVIFAGIHDDAITLPIAVLPFNRQPGSLTIDHITGIQRREGIGPVRYPGKSTDCPVRLNVKIPGIGFNPGYKNNILACIPSGIFFIRRRSDNMSTGYCRLSRRSKEEESSYPMNTYFSNRSRSMEQQDGTFHDAIIDFLPDATLVIDRNGMVIAWNKAMEALTGVPAGSMLGKGDYEYAVPFYKERRPILVDLVFMPEFEIEKKYDFVERRGDTLVVDIFIPNFRPGGVYLWAKAAPLYDPQGNVTGAIETVRDITDRKRDEQEIVRSRRSLADIISFLPDATFAIDQNGVVITWNKAMEELAGIPAASMIGKGDFEYSLPFYHERRPMLANLILMPESDVERLYAHVQREGDTLVVDTFIPDLLGRSGRYFWAKASPLYDPQGNVTGAIETIRDITERREMEGRLARSNAELQIAAEIQKSFMPEVIPQITGFDIAARTVMAKEVGGDFFDVIPFEIIALDKGTLGLLIADVSGKGVPAALFMALSRIVVRVNALWHRDPAKAIYDANNIITHDSRSGMFVTLFFGTLRETDRTLTYVNAGHNPPVFFRNCDGTLEDLMPTGIVLGAVENRKYFSRTLTIGPGDIVVMYTDGVTESINAQEELFGEDRLNSIIRDNARLPAQEILDRILSAVREYTGDLPQFDDITLMVIKGI